MNVKFDSLDFDTSSKFKLGLTANGIQYYMVMVYQGTLYGNCNLDGLDPVVENYRRR